MGTYTIRLYRTVPQWKDVTLQADTTEEAWKKVDDGKWDSETPIDLSANFPNPEWRGLEVIVYPNEETFSKEDWIYEVENGDTILGYQEWREHKAEEGADNA